MLLATKTAVVIGEASTAVEAATKTASLQPDIVVLDASLPDADELEALRQIARASLPVRIILLSEQDNEEFVEQALTSGASAFLLKQTAATDLAWAVKAAQKGREYFSPALIRRLRDPSATIPEPDQAEDLADPAASPMEACLMALLNQGLVIRQLAQELRRNIESVRRQHPALLAKLRPRRWASFFGSSLHHSITPVFLL
jgi:DNA-binding NarL/FixJ family response regulator